MWVFSLQNDVANTFRGKMPMNLRRKKSSWHSAASAFQCQVGPAKLKDRERNHTSPTKIFGTKKYLASSKYDMRLQNLVRALLY